MLDARLRGVPIPAEIADRLAFLTDAFGDTPGGWGLIETGMAEAAIAADHVRLAGRDTTDLGNMIRSMSHVLHAIDPAEVGNGFGLGYGVRRSAQAMLFHLDAVAAESEIPPAVRLHVDLAKGGASGALQHAEAAIALARSVQRATTPQQAHRLVDRLSDLVRAMAYGRDADGDGRIGYHEAESGLAQATYHLNVLRAMERSGG
ncbi:MAG: hypothetical protein O2956_08065 [Gemmatimonadetes bacterium]|nr:hypothetical protein [Gemmatimonadota bacterium]